LQTDELTKKQIYAILYGVNIKIDSMSKEVPILPISPTEPHIVTHVGEPHAVAPLEQAQLNLTMGHIQDTHIFPEDPTYQGLKEHALNAKEQAYNATHDSLTGLLNRAGFEQKYEDIMEVAASDPKARYAFIRLDFDGFKVINDTNGHGAGDDLLREWANSIHLREGDIIGRYGGDEFDLFINTAFGKNGEREYKEEDDAIGGTINHVGTEALETARRLGLDLKGVTAGVAIWKPSKSLSELKTEADDELYANKRAGQTRALNYRVN
jgi:diguanylate cyclase (GGDEF)-like protein